MHSGLQAYLNAVILALISLGIPLLVRISSLFFSRHIPPRKTSEAKPVPQSFNSRFYLPALSISFVVVGILILSVGVSEISRDGSTEKSWVYGTIYFLLIGFLTMTFLFSVKRGNLNWNIGVQDGKGHE